MKLGVNLGYDRVRFVKPVRVGETIHAGGERQAGAIELRT